ncbi:MAG: hypothetical protein KJZ78_14365 [Bryobacteraceae bacterium]|nr:hypothetical protein [Bryobacteraceae bacterium]
MPVSKFDAAHAAIIQEAAALPDFSSMTVQQLQDEAKKHGISIAKTKSQFIAELEKLEPNPAKPHFMLKGQELETKIKQFGIGKLKPKEMLVSDLQKALSIDKKAVQAVEEAVKVLMQKRTNSAGEIITDGTERDLSSIFGRGMADGTQFEIEFEDGVTAVYRPWAGNTDIFAAAGELEVRVEGACAPGVVEKSLEKIERLGLNASPAAIEDAEIMYLQKQAYVQGIPASTKPSYRATCLTGFNRSSRKTAAAAQTRHALRHRLCSRAS